MSIYKQGKVEIRNSVVHDICHLKDNLRKSDVDEIVASCNGTPEDMLMTGYAVSEICFTVVYESTPVAMFGVDKASSKDGMGIVWLLGTEDISKMWVTFLRLSRPIVREMAWMAGTDLHNYIDARNTSTIEWLKWCGAQFEDAEPYGVMGLPFHHFILKGGE